MAADVADVSLFLCDGRQCPGITAQQLTGLKERLRADPNVADVTYESKRMPGSGSSRRSPTSPS